MTTELARELARLGEERARLEGLLARHPVWLAIRQLDRRQAPADAFGDAVRARRRADLERQLSGNPVFEAHRDVIQAIAVIESSGAGQKSASEAETPAQVETMSSPARLVPAMSRHAERLAIEEARGAGGIITRSATIHGALPGHRDASSVAPADAPPDDLTRIRRIDRALATALVARGVRSFAQIASFGAADVRSLAVALGLGRRISQENWIEQAAVLALKQRSQVPQAPGDAKRVAPDHAASAAVPVEGSADAPASRPDVAAVARAIARDVARRGKQDQAASPTNGPDVDDDTNQGKKAPDGDTMGKAAPLVAMPAASHVAREAALRIAGQWRQPPPLAETKPPPVTAVEDATTDNVIAAGPSDAEPALAADAATADDLTLVRGIDVAARSVLASLGVSRFAQIAAWCAADVRAASEALAQASVSAQISCDGWIEQAAVLARGGQTRHAARIERGELGALVSRPDAPAERNAAFADWLDRHAASHAVADALPIVADEAEVPAALEAAERDGEVCVCEPSREDEAQAMAPETPLPHLLGFVEHSEPLPVPVSPVEPVIGAFAEMTQSIEVAAPSPPPSPPTARVIEYLPCEPVEVPLADGPDVAVPPAASAIAAASIADRITAIELEAEWLSLRSRPAVKGRWPAGSPGAYAGFAEADVKIVRRDVQDAARKPAAATPQPAAEATDLSNDDYAAYRDGAEEASVEIVRDGRIWEPDEGRGASADAAADATAPLRGALRRVSALGPQHLIRVRRFLKSLTGE